MKSAIFVCLFVVVLFIAASVMGGIVGDGATFKGASPLTLAPATFATLTPCAAAAEGLLGAVNDANSTLAWGSVVNVGASTGHVLVYCDGTNYTVVAK